MDRLADSSPTLTPLTTARNCDSPGKTCSAEETAGRTPTLPGTRHAHSDDFVSLPAYCEDPANRAPRVAPTTVQAQPTADHEQPAPSVFNPATGKVRVMSGKCPTCIGRAGNCLSDERRRELLGLRPDGTYDEGWTICHSTLPGNSDDLPPAVCAWIASHPQAASRSLAMRIGAAHGIEYIDPPAKP